MREKQKNNEVYQASHLAILICYTVFSAVLIGATFLLSWEVWAMPLVAIAVIACWWMHLNQKLTAYARLWIYSILMMVTFFLFGIHESSLYDQAPVMEVILMLFAMSGVSKLINLGQVTYFVTMAYGIIRLLIEGVTFDRVTAAKTVLHIVLILMIGGVGRVFIRKQREISERTTEEIRELELTAKRMDDFLANMSHEIRTPINAVIGLSSVALKKVDDETVLRDLASIKDAGHRVAEQIGDVLDYTELDMGRLAVNTEPYMISSLINDLVIQLQAFRRPGIELIIDVDASVPSVLIGDPVKLKKILWHLAQNGLKFCRAGGVYIRVYAVTRSYGINLSMEVRDTGIGMKREEVERIFENFYQSDSGRTRATGGLGLGLTIVQGFVNAMNGFLSVDSRQEEGTVIRVSIPQKVDNASPCMSVAKREKLCVAALLHFGDVKNPQMREYYRDTIRHLSQGLSIPIHFADRISDMDKLQTAYQITHIFIGPEEYEQDEEYFETLPRDTTVVLVAEEDFPLRPLSRIKLLSKPLYCFAITSFLNYAAEGTPDDNTQIYCPGLTALVVDDEPMNLLVADGIFRNYGMEVTKALSGPEALALTEKQDFDLIFMDHMMPEMDGIEAMKRIRSQVSKRGGELIIIALTANAVSSAKDMFLSEGFDGFVPKPIETAELERVLKRVLPKSAITYEKPDHIPTIKEEKKISPEAGGKPGNAFAKLRICGVDTVKGIRYCQNDEDFYESLLMEYASGARERTEELRKFYDAKDWKNYAIRAHAIKSTSKMIGAESVSVMAKDLEEAAKSGDEVFLEREHEHLLTVYGHLTDVIDELYGPKKEEEILEFEPGGDSDPEILEFAPEESVPEPLPQKKEEEILEFEPEGDGEEILEFLPEGEDE